MEDEEIPVDRNPLPVSNYQPAEGSIGNLTLPSHFNFGVDFSQDWGYTNLADWLSKFRDPNDPASWATSMQDWGQDPQQNAQAAMDDQRILDQYLNKQNKQY